MLLKPELVVCAVLAAIPELQGCCLAYFHWKRAPSREQSVHYIIILVSETSQVNKNQYTFFAKLIFLCWLGCSLNWASLARHLTQISGAVRHARLARWVSLGERLSQIGIQPTRAQPARLLTSGRAGPPESLALQPRRGEEGSEAGPQANQLPHQWAWSQWARWRVCVTLPRGSGTFNEGVFSWLSLNAQDEQQWREIHAKATTVSSCKAQKIRVIINLKL